MQAAYMQSHRRLKDRECHERPQTLTFACNGDSGYRCFAKCEMATRHQRTSKITQCYRRNRTRSPVARDRIPPMEHCCCADHGVSAFCKMRNGDLPAKFTQHYLTPLPCHCRHCELPRSTIAPRPTAIAASKNGQDRPSPPKSHPLPPCQSLQPPAIRSPLISTIAPFKTTPLDIDSFTFL